MKLDISHFKKVHEDHNTAILRHENGNEIKVAKSSLNAAMKAKLARLPICMEEGGQVYSDDMMARIMQEQQNAQDAERLGLQHEQEQAAMANRMPTETGEINRSPAGIGSYIGNAIHDSVGDALGAAKTVIGGAARPIINEGKGFFQGLAGSQPEEPGDGQAALSAVEKQGPRFGNAELLGPTTRGSSGGSPELQGIKNQGMKSASNMMGDFNKVQQGMRNEAKAEGELGRQQAIAADNANKNSDNILAMHNKKYQELSTEVDNSIKDYQSSKISSKNYTESKSVGSKIATAIGLILGGIGGGLLRQENPALAFLNKNIDRDIDAQKANLNNKNTVLSAYLHKTKDLTEATAMTRAFFLEKYSNDIAKAAALSKAPLAQSRADQVIGKLNFEKNQLLNAIAEKQSKMEFVRNASGTVDPSQLVIHVVPKEHQAQVFKEIYVAQNTKRMTKELRHIFEEAAKENTFLKTGGGKLRTPPSVMALHQALGPTFADLEGSVAQSTIDNVKTNLTPRPGDLESTINTKRAALNSYLQSKSSAPTAKGFGIDLSRFESTAVNNEKRINAPEGYKGKHGK